MYVYIPTVSSEIVAIQQFSIHLFDWAASICHSYNPSDLLGTDGRHGVTTDNVIIAC